MPFFQGATNVNASNSVFNEVNGNQVNHFNGGFGISHVNSGNNTTNTNSNNDSSTRNNFNVGGQQSVNEFPPWSNNPGAQGFQPHPSLSPTSSSPGSSWSNPGLSSTATSFTASSVSPGVPQQTPPPASHAGTPAPAAPVNHEAAALPAENAPVTPHVAPPAAPPPSEQSPQRQNLKKKKQKQKNDSDSSSLPSDSDGSEAMDVSLAISGFVLTALQFASQSAPVPFLQAAASSALSIVKSAQQAKGNKDDFERLAQDACDLVYVVINIYKAQDNINDMPDDLEGELKVLVKTLTKIDEFGKKQSKRHGLKRLILSNLDSGKIREFREKLNHALNKFWLQSSIHVRQQLSAIAKQQGTIQKDIANANPAPGIPATNGREILTALSGIDFSNNFWMNGGSHQGNVNHMDTSH